MNTRSNGPSSVLRVSSSVLLVHQSYRRCPSETVTKLVSWWAGAVRPRPLCRWGRGPSRPWCRRRGRRGGSGGTRRGAASTPGPEPARLPRAASPPADEESNGRGSSCSPLRRPESMPSAIFTLSRTSGARRFLGHRVARLDSAGVRKVRISLTTCRFAPQRESSAARA